LFLEMDDVDDLDGIIEAHSRYLGQLEEDLFLNEETTMVNAIEARKRFNEQQKILAHKDVYDTKFFEQEEERIRLEELQQHLEECYQPKVKNLNSKFVLLIRDILNILTAPPRKIHYVELALRLDFTGFYRNCEI
uniref:GCP_C_terminal domain-containing protein n=1 Tax=Brugia timori TaxID=42155 RepID=A0A0R3Q9E5_9BILA